MSKALAIGGTIAAVAAVSGAYMFGTTQSELPTVQAQYASQAQPVNIDEVCSAISADSVGRFKAAGIINFEGDVPDDFAATYVRGKLGCTGEPVTGPEANKRICNNLSVAGVTELFNRLDITLEGDVNSAVDQARGVFNCNSDADFPPPVDETDSPSTTTTTTTNKSVPPADNPVQNPKYNDVDPDKVQK